MAGRSHPLFRAGLLAGGIAALAACRDDTPTPLSPDADAARAAAPAGERRGRGPLTWDDELAAVAEQAPGFGGFFRESENGPAVVWLTDLGRSQQARAAVATLLARTGDAGRGITFRQGRHDFRDLARWRRALDDARLPGLTLSDVDETANRVLVGVKDAASAREARAAVARLGVPAGAVEVREIAPTVTEVTLQQYYRPVQGGLQIQAPGTCTLGYIAVEDRIWYIDWSSPRYLITNSHCTSSFGYVSGDQVGQPTLSYPIGTEYSDPPLWTNSTDSRCPVGRNCRWSDAAMFQLSSNSTSVSRFSAFSRTSSGLNLGSPDREYYVAEYNSISPGMAVEKVGRTTGRTTGSVTNSCANVPQYATDPWGYVYDTGRTMLCQVQASYSSGGGDSGSPVTIRNSSGQPQVYGIHWGSNGTTATFSFWGYMWSEIGNDVLARTGVQWTIELVETRGNPATYNP